MRTSPIGSSAEKVSLSKIASTCHARQGGVCWAVDGGMRVARRVRRGARAVAGAQSLDWPHQLQAHLLRIHRELESLPVANDGDSQLSLTMKPAG